jgi:hypothetical protein
MLTQYGPSGGTMERNQEISRALRKKAIHNENAVACRRRKFVLGWPINLPLRK